MNFSPIAVMNTTAMTESTTAGSLTDSSDESQLSEFTALLSDSLAQQQTPNDGQPSGGEHTEQQQLQLALRSLGQELPLTGESLPPGKLTDAELQSLTALLPASLTAAVQAQGTAPVNIDAADSSMATIAKAGVQQGAILKGDNAVIANVMTAPTTTASQQAALASAVADEIAVDIQQNPAISRMAVAAAQAGPTTEEQEVAIPAQLLNQRSPVTGLNPQPLTLMQQSGIPMQSGNGEQALHGQPETTPLTLLPEGRVASTENSADFSRMIEKGLAQLSRDMSPSAHVPLTEPASRTSLDGMKLSTDSLLLQQPIDKPKWGQEFGNRMVWMTKEGIQNAQLRLTPAHLGTIEVKISIHNDQANVSFMSQHGAVRDVIESTLPRLREMMQEAGVKLEQANVSGGETNTNAQQRHADKSPTQFGQTNHASVSDDEEATTSTAMPMEHEGNLSAVDYYA